MAQPPETYPEDIRNTFEICEDCGSLVVHLAAHQCPAAESPAPTSVADRAKLAEADDRPLEEEVKYPTGRSSNNAWAYHEVDEDGEPLHELSHKSGTETGSREEAINAGCYPCGHCRTLEERGENDG